MLLGYVLPTMLYVILPQTFRNIIPQIGNNLIINIKDTSVLSDQHHDLFFVSRSVSGSLYNYFGRDDCHGDLPFDALGASYSFENLKRKSTVKNTTICPRRIRLHTRAVSCAMSGSQKNNGNSHAI